MSYQWSNRKVFQFQAAVLSTQGITHTDMQKSAGPLSLLDTNYSPTKTLTVLRGFPHRHQVLHGYLTQRTPRATWYNLSVAPTSQCYSLKSVSLKCMVIVCLSCSKFIPCKHVINRTKNQLSSFTTGSGVSHIELSHKLLQRWGHWMLRASLRQSSQTYYRPER